MDYLDFIIFSAIIAGVVATVIVVVYAKFQGGLAVRIFGLAGPAMGIIAIVGYGVGALGLSISSVATFVPIGTVAGVVSLLLLYRLVVKGTGSRVEGLLAETSQISATAQQTAATASEQSSMVTQVSTTVEELQQTSAAATSVAESVLRSSEDAVAAGRGGLDAVERAVSIMEAIAETRRIVEMINELAEQSNLLAVNASIEAANAGEQGRGFSVVAAEVRNLAEQSKAAARQIREAIDRTEDGRAAIAEVHRALRRLGGVLEENADSARQISATAGQQSSGIEQIGQAMTAVDQGSRDTAGASRQLEQAVANLSRLGVELRTFVVGDAAPGVGNGRGGSTQPAARPGAP